MIRQIMTSTVRSGEDGPGQSRKKLRIWMAAVITVLALAVYANCLLNGFVHDDFPQIVQNPWVADFSRLAAIFTSHVGGFEQDSISNYYRPVMYLLYMVTYFFFGSAAWGFHLVNVLLHAGVSILVFVLTFRLLRDAGVSEQSSSLCSFAASVVFAVHPIHTEAVAWAAGIPDLSFTLFVLLSFHFYIKADGRGTYHYLLSLFFFFLAALSKEPALVLPVVLFAYDLGYGKNPKKLFDYGKRYAAYVILAGLYIFLRWNALGGFAPAASHAELSSYQYIINVFPLFARYLEKLVLPLNLNFFHVLRPIETLLEPRALVSLAITAGFCVSVPMAYTKNKTVFLALVIIAIPLIPVLYIPAVGQNTFAERYLYFPSFGFVLLIAGVLSATGRRDLRGVMVYTAVLGLATMIFAAGTIRRNAVWKDNYSIWTDTVRKSADAAYPHYQLADELFRLGRTDKAIEHYEIAAQLRPDLVSIHNNLGLAYLRKGRLDKAVEEFQAALRVKPDSAQALNNLGLAYKNMGRLDLAIERYQEALRLSPSNIGLLYNLGNVYEQKGMADEAILYFEAAFRLDPQNALIWQRIANARSLKERRAGGAGSFPGRPAGR